MRIREANINDAEQIAKVHVDSWRTTYTGLIADSYIDQLSVDKRRKNWEWTFDNLNKDEVLYVATNDDDRIVGFSNGGRSRNEEFEHESELYAIYLLKEVQGKGIGTLLLQFVVASLAKSGYHSMMVWVLDGNPAIDFYKAMGGLIIGQKEITVGGKRHIEIAYGWENIKNIGL